MPNAAAVAMVQDCVLDVVLVQPWIFCLTVVLLQISKKDHAPSATVGRSASYKRSGKW